MLRSMLNYDLPCEQSTDLAVIFTVVIEDSLKGLAYPYMLHAKEEVPTTIVDVFSSWIYVWDSNEMLSSNCLRVEPGLSWRQV